MRFHRVSAVSTTIHADRIDVDFPHSGHLTGTRTVRGRLFHGAFDGARVFAGASAAGAPPAAACGGACSSIFCMSSSRQTQDTAIDITGDGARHLGETTEIRGLRVRRSEDSAACQIEHEIR